MTRAFVAATHWEMPWSIIERSLQCFCLIGFMWSFFWRVQISASFFPDMQRFQQSFKKKNVVRVRHTIEDPILEPKNGIASIFLAPVGFHYWNHFWGLKWCTRGSEPTWEDDYIDKAVFVPNFPVELVVIFYIGVYFIWLYYCLWVCS